MTERQPERSMDQDTVRARRGRVDSVDIFEVKENELDVLERGSFADIYLNYAIFLLSLAFSGAVALATATFASEIVKAIVQIVMVGGFLAGPLLLILWFRDRQSVRAVAKRIRDRISIAPAAPTAQAQPAEVVEEATLAGQGEGESPEPPKPE